LADPLLELVSLVKRHGGALAVDHVSFAIHRGEFFSILGPSGAGKTSVLRMIAGFESPDEGEIRIEGRSIRGVPPHHRPVNLVFQSYALFPHLTVGENVAFGPAMQGVADAEIHSSVRAVLDMVKLTGKETRLPAQLSGGEQQRVALARALINQPAVLLLDEPLSALDQQLRQEMQVELKAIQKRVGITFVCVTHHQREALAMSDRIAVMHQGRVLQIGTPEEIYDAPESRFIAQFVGTSNELRGMLIARETGSGLFRSHDLEDSQSLWVHVAGDVGLHRPVTFMVRPERLHLSATFGSPAFDNSLQGRVEKVFYLGSELQYTIQLSGSVQWTVQVPCLSGGQKVWPVGTMLFVQWQAHDGLVLPL
jgi:spermidine/putrescine transport system ATP-binding protein